MKDSELLQFLYNRLIIKYEENNAIDYMQDLNSIIEKTRKRELKKESKKDKWIKWEATADSVCPVGHYTYVEIKFTFEGVDYGEIGIAGQYMWSDCISNIYKYRIIKE